MAKPVGVYVTTFGTGVVEDAKISKVVANLFRLPPARADRGARFAAPHLPPRRPTATSAAPEKTFHLGGQSRAQEARRRTAAQVGWQVSKPPRRAEEVTRPSGSLAALATSPSCLPVTVRGGGATRSTHAPDCAGAPAAVVCSDACSGTLFCRRSCVPMWDRAESHADCCFQRAARSICSAHGAADCLVRPASVRGDSPLVVSEAWCSRFG